MRFWVMALRQKDDGSRPSMLEALEAGALYPTRALCIRDSALDGPEWQPVAVEVRLLTKLTLGSEGPTNDAKGKA